MAVKNEKYVREFDSQTEYYESGNHEFSESIPYQTINQEDKEIREKMVEKFALSRKRSGLDETCYGFDGKRQYKFNIVTNFPKELQGDTEENGKYQTTVEIEKAGNKKNINQLSDLEKFLDSKNFERQH